MNKYDYLKNTSDLTLPDWGPYSRDFFAASHIADHDKGFRMDFFMVPGLARRRFCPPETLHECDYSPWEASADLSYYSARQQIIGRNEFFTETSYSRISPNFRLGRIEFVNHTSESQTASLMLFSHFAPRNEVAVQLPESALWLDALDHVDVEYAYFRMDRNLVYSGGRRGEEQNFPGTVHSRCLGKPHYDRALPCFGEAAGDRVYYNFDYRSAAGKLLMRARLEHGETLALNVEIGGEVYSHMVTGTGQFELYELYFGIIAPGQLQLISGGSAHGIRIDGFIFMSRETPIGAISFPLISHAVTPRAVPGPIAKSNLIMADAFDTSYIVWWSTSAAGEREYWVDDLSKLLSFSYLLRHPDYTPEMLFKGVKGSSYCKETYILPIAVEPGASMILYAIYGAGELNTLPDELNKIDRTPAAMEEIYQQNKQNAFGLPATPAGEKYRFSQQLMSAAVMTNIAFPVLAKGKNIRHHVPDKFFYSLYSWDSGFTGLGLAEFDQHRAIENLNAYVTEPDDEECAFLLHGTPLPVQAYLYLELWNRTQDRDLLEFFYPRLRHFYDFLAGHIESSRFRHFKTDILNGMEYCYNAGGWDDYPPQWQLLHDKRFDAAPVVTSAHTIRFARILKEAALILGGHETDLALYERDIEALGNGLQNYSWNEDDGVFSYVIHNEDGTFKEHYLDPKSGVNFNFGLDGATPLLAGICTPAQENRLFTMLTTEERFWSKYGLSAVDMSQPYFRTDGYWNGSVWMPHQWFFWKTALDHNRADFARKIAITALELWKHEVDQSFYCFEHFSLQNGHGAGCCHFGALSSPVLCWHHAYFAPGKLTGGFDLWVIQQQSNADGGISAQIKLCGVPGHAATLLYVNGGMASFQATYNGEPIPAITGIPGCLELTLPNGSNGMLEIFKLQ